MTANSQSWITAVSVAFAAIAAAASWVSIHLSRRQWILAQQPFLSAQLVIRHTGERELRILNAGVGAARGVRFCVVVEDKFVAGYAGPQYGGFLVPGDTACVVVDLNGLKGARARGVVLCWDGAGRVHRFTMEGEHSVLRRPPSMSEASTNPEAAYQDIYGSGTLESLLRVSGRGKHPSLGS